MPTPRKHLNQAERQRAYLERQKAAQRAALAAKNMPPLSPIPTIPSRTRWRALSEQAQTILQTILDEMEFYREERSDEWQESEQGDAFQEAIDRVQEALGSAAQMDL